MKNWSKKLLSALCVAALILGLVPLGVPALAAEEHTLWLVGDSTVCAFNDAYYYPRYGYGTQIGNYLDGTYKVENLALSGRSSKSFLTEANYETLKAGIKAGDALIIGFGHNDEKAEADRYTNPNGDWQTEGSFAKSLYDNYVKLAQDAEAEAILCTPIVRRAKNATFSQSELHITADSGNFPGGDYPAAIRKLGADKNAAVVDLTKITQELYEGLGPEKTLYLHAWTSMKEGSVDNTHLNIYGAKVVAYQLAKALQAGGTELGKHVDLSAGEPTQEKDLVSNPEYKEPTYDPNLPASLYWKDYTCYNLADDTQVLTFKGTVFGDIGGQVALEGADPVNHVLETDENGNMHIQVMNNKGKIATGSDGIAMYYMQLPVGTQFEFSAKATVNQIDANNQVAFGLMARDDMYIDLLDGTIKSDYVVAGTLGSAAGKNNSCNCFFRQNGALGGKAPLTVETVEAGKSYDLSIKSNSDGFACTFGNEPTQTGGYDFALTSVDSDYFYIGMFVARKADVTFSDISLVITAQPDQPGTPDTPDQPVDGMVAGGGLETIFAELEDVKDADVSAVKYTDGTTEVALEGEDFQYLVRDAEGGVRIDIPGVKAGTYDLTVTVAGQDYVAKGIQVEAHDRSGFAHQTVDENNVCTPYTEGVGAYNDDGTLKDNAIVLYVTEENKDTDAVTLSYNGVTLTGIGNILNSKGQSDSNKRKLLQKVSEAGIPIVVRVLGTVTNPAGTTTPWSKENGGSTDDGGHMCIMQYVGNITIEGIGPDATVDGWGFSFSADGTGRTAEKNNKRDGQGENIEVRNLTFRNVPEDCIGINGSQDDKDGFKDSAEHVWVHNNSFYGPSGLHDESKDQDKSGGDGALDFRNGEYMTSSYNYFEGYHKTSLVGSGNDNLQYHITWHHNHWKNVESRAPLARQADMHIYNNYYENQKSYCMSLRANVYVFSEANTFSGCQNPMVDEKSGGVCKSYNDVFENCTWKINTETQARGDNNIVTDKNQTVESANKFANFDTAEGSYVKQGNYKLDTAADALKNIETYGGVMKAAADMKTVPFSLASGSEPAEPTLTVTPETLTLKVGETGTLTATLTGSEDAITWESDKPEVATVDNGTVTAVAAGEATITAKAGELTATATVTVTDEGGDQPDVPEEITIKINTSKITVRKTEKLRYTLTPEDAVYGTIYWVSDDTSVLSVTADGQATGVKTGKANVTAYVLKAAADGLTEDNILAEATREIQVVSGGTVNNAGGTTGQTTTPAKTETTTNDSGNTVKTESKSNGDKVVTVTDESGEVVAKVEIPAQTPDLGYKFEDVPDDHWAEPSIQAMAAMKVFQGVSTTGHIFDMNSAVTRGTMAQILFNLSQGKAGIDNPFTDAQGNWYSDAVAWAASAGVVTGVSDTNFAPNDSITREQLATMLYRYAKLLDLDVSAKGDLTAFVDGSAVDSWASEAMTWAVGAGLIQGKGSNDLDPTASATRAEAAVIIDRFLMMV